MECTISTYTIVKKVYTYIIIRENSLKLNLLCYINGGY